jgi:hypothetical protein
MKLCTVPGCKNKFNAKGYCMTHYRRWRLHGDINFGRAESNASRKIIVCTILECNKPNYVKGLCQMHNKRLKVHGDPLYIRPKYRCLVINCKRPYKAKGLCQLHYSRKRLGYVGIPKIIDNKRYISRTCKDHPIAPKSGRISEHRIVLFDAIGMGRFPCFWCGTSLQWIVNDSCSQKLFVDHVDYNKHNNVETNLVPSCNRCNVSRTRRNYNVNLVSIYSADPFDANGVEPMTRCRCNGIYSGCEHGIACHNTAGGFRSEYFCADCDRRRINHISDGLQKILAEFDQAKS